MTDRFYGDETLLIFYETSSFSLFIILAKSIIFNIMKFYMETPIETDLMSGRSHIQEQPWINIIELDKY